MERLADLRNARGWSQARLAEESGLSQPVIARFETGERGPKMWQIEQIARAFGMTPSEFLGHIVPGNAEPITLPEAKRQVRKVKIVGYVGGGAEVHYPEGADPDEMETTEVISAGDDVEAVVVRGASMSPVYDDRDVLVYRKATFPARDLIGQGCVVRLADGRTFVKVLTQGSEPNLFTLLSYNPATPPITDVAIEWAVPVAERKSGRWRLG